MRTYAASVYLCIVCADYASTHNIRRMRICALNAHYRASALMRIICAHAHVRIICARILCLRSCRLRLRRLSSCPHCYSGGGGSCRRQGKSAAPSGRRGERLGRYRRVSSCVFETQREKRQEREGAGVSRVPAPGPRARPAREVWRKWWVRGV